MDKNRYRQRLEQIIKELYDRQNSSAYSGIATEYYAWLTDSQVVELRRQGYYVYPCP